MPCSILVRQAHTSELRNVGYDKKGGASHPFNFGAQTNGLFVSGGSKVIVIRHLATNMAMLPTIRWATPSVVNADGVYEPSGNHNYLQRTWREAA